MLIKLQCVASDSSELKSEFSMNDELDLKPVAVSMDSIDSIGPEFDLSLRKKDGTVVYDGKAVKVVMRGEKSFYAPMTVDEFWKSYSAAFAQK